MPNLRPRACRWSASAFMSGKWPFGRIVPSSLRVFPLRLGSFRALSAETCAPYCQPSSRLTYVQPVSARPFSTNARAVSRTIPSVISHRQAFHALHPIGGVRHSLSPTEMTSVRRACPCAFFATNGIR